MERTNAKFVRHTSCDNCGSSDANAVYDDGTTWCFSCETFGSEDNMEAAQSPIKNVYTSNLSSGQITGIPDRKISADTCKAYNVTTLTNNGTIFKHIYPYYDDSNTQIATKIRTVQNKGFLSEGNMSGAVLFGRNKFSAKGKYITITEGELDAMAAYQMFGSKWPCVSVKSSSSALADCKKSFDYLNSFENIIICFDNDAAGHKAAEKVAGLFEPHKCKIVNLSQFKDASDYLRTGNQESFVRTWWAAEPYTPAGIINLDELGDTLYEEDFCETVPYPWTGLNKKIYGMRTGELLTFTSGSGMGKSSIIRELMHHIMKTSTDNIGVLALEESIRNTALNIMSVEASQRLYIKEVRDTFSIDQLQKWQSATVGTGRFFAFDHFGSISNDEILNRVRFMAKALDCKWIILDHLSILVSGQEDGDERRSIDILMTKLRSLVEETGVGLLLVSHLRRASGDKGHEDGREVSLAHLRGSQSIAHLSDGVIALERNQQEEDETLANTTVVRILKNRYTGDTGIATYLYYDKDSGRMSEISNPFDVNEDDEEEGFDND
jgi:twinkle protein